MWFIIHVNEATALQMEKELSQLVHIESMIDRDAVASHKGHVLNAMAL